MTFLQELASWNPLYFGKQKVQAVPQPGSPAPSAGELAFPRADGKPTVLVFLRHCGCPFAEKVFVQLRKLADAHAEVACVAVSHSDAAATAQWVQDVGGTGAVHVVVDADLAIYAAWGLGASSFWHVLNPTTLGAVKTVEQQDGIAIRSTQSGSRWQQAGAYAVNGKGAVVWGGPSASADEIADVEAAMAAAKK